MSLDVHEYMSQDAVGLADLVRRGEVSADELVETAIGQIERHDGTINAVIHRDFAAARSGAKAAVTGPFSGVPFLAKDLNTEMAGLPATRGSRLLKDRIATADSEIIRRYRSAGLIPLGLTNTPEFGLNLSTEPVAYGPTRHPAAGGLSPGGSSGGSAAAILAGYVPAAHATDSSGSIRAPASLCGLIGLKPSRGRVPILPPLARDPNTVTTAHVLARSVRDCAALLDVVRAPYAETAISPPQPSLPFAEDIEAPPGGAVCVMITPQRAGYPVSPECVAAMEACARRLEGHGAVIDELPCLVHLPDLFEPMVTTVARRMHAAVRDALAGQADQSAKPERVVAEFAEIGKTIDDVRYAAAIQDCIRLARPFQDLFDTVDLVLTPTLFVDRIRLGELDAARTGHDRFYRRMLACAGFLPLYNITGAPAISLPVGCTGDGLPVGVMLGARFGAEARLLGVAAMLERETPWETPPIGRIADEVR